MKKKLLILLFSILLLIIIITLVVKLKKEQVFYLNDKYYGTSSLIETDTNEIDNLIKNKESFALLVHSSEGCNVSKDFEKIIKEFIDTYEISLYSTSFKNMCETKISKQMIYTPSVVIFKKGKLVTYLNAISNEDLPYYESKENFKEWFSKYVFLNDN